MNQRNTIEIGAFEAKNRLSTYLEMAEKGKQIWITKHGRRVALLSSGLETPASSPSDLSERLRAFRSSTLPSAGNESIKDLIDEGRR